VKRANGRLFPAAFLAYTDISLCNSLRVVIYIILRILSIIYYEHVLSHEKVTRIMKDIEILFKGGFIK